MRNKILIITLVAVVFAMTVPEPASGDAGLGEPVRLMRMPDISNGRIVFNYQGDLWLVPEEGGIARRLTVHPGVESYAKFSPDGKNIAFSGSYNERSSALFVIPSEGGKPKQMTWHSNSALPVEWTRDGKNIVFRSSRDSYVRFFKQLYSVPLDGGLPVDMGVGKASFCSFSPDGRMIAFNRHPGRWWWWKRYKGSQNLDVWTYDLEKEKYRQLTSYDGNDMWPMWSGERIFFVSDRDTGIKNIYSYDLGTEKIRQVTSFSGKGVTWPSISSDGTKIVFEREARLYVLNTDNDEVKEVVVYVLSDDRVNMISYIKPLDYLSGFDISPTGKRLVICARGEIFTAPAKHGDVRNLTNSSGARDNYPSWSPDGKWIAYVSDRTGDDEIYLAHQMGKEPEKRLTDTGHFKKNILWGPESKRLLYSTEANELFMLDVDGGKPFLVVKNEHEDIATYNWSPDGKWIAYDFAQRNRARDIYFYNIKNKEHHQVTKNLADDTEPYFTPDGKYLLFISERRVGAKSLCRLSLLPEEKHPFIHKDDEEGIDGEDADDDNDDAEDEDNGKKDKKSKKGKKKKEKVKVKIDFAGIEDRAWRVGRIGGRGLHNIQATEKYYYYLTTSKKRVMFRRVYDLHAYNVKKMESKLIASAIGTYGISANKEKIGIFDGTDFEIIKVGSKKSSAKSKTATDAKKDNGKLNIKRKVGMELDRKAEWKQIMREGWRVVKYHFYDSNFHGVNWDEIGDYYESLLPWVRTRRELNILMTEMVGELNASHQGASGGDGPSVPRKTLGFLGAKVALDEKSGYARIEKIFKGNNFSSKLRSPLDADYIKIKNGDYLLAVEGHELEPGENFYKYLVGKTKNKISVVTNDKPSLKGAVETVFKPVAQDISLRYKDWVIGSTGYVDEKSSGRIGYMHLKDMSSAGWVEFREQFEKYRYKEAIIIDVRYNGGGYIDSKVIDLLERRPYHVQRSRGESVINRPEDVFTGEVVVLINEYSYSDAEVFPSAVKERGLGTLIGVPTLGFVIAVMPHDLVDKGTIRKTFIGIWEKDDGAQLESRGAIPDIHVESTPEMEKAGRDVQLEKAMEFLLGKIGDTPRDFDVDVKIDER